MNRFRNKAAAGAIAVALVGLGVPLLGWAQSQESPESILPPGFGDPAPAPTPAPATPAPTATGPGATGLQRPDVEPTLPGGIGAPVPGVVPDDAGAEAPPIDPVLLAEYELPTYARRSTAVVGVVGTAEGGFPETAFGSADGRFLQGLMQRTNAPIASRWVSIGLRRALASKVATPTAVNGADFAAERAWLLLRMGESAVARALVQGVDTDRYTPKMFEAAMQVALANGDPALVCPAVEPARAVSRDRAWTLAGAMCASLSGRTDEAAAAIKSAQRSGTARGIDLLLAQRIVGTGGKGQGGVTIEWDGVDQLTAWRYGLATAGNVEIPLALLGTVSPRVQFWRAQAGGVPARARAEAAELAAAQGVLSNAALVDLYSAIDGDEDQSTAETGVARDLRTAYAGGDRDVRLAAFRTLWEEPRLPRGRYARLILTARAAATIVPYRDAPDADRLVASMLSAGLEARALRWADMVPRGGDAWAMLTLAGSRAASRSDIDSYRGRPTDPDGTKARMLTAALAGLGQLDGGDTAALAGALKIDFDGQNSWTRAIHRAAEQRQPATVLLLAAVGMQTPNWHGVSPEALYHIVASLRQVGLDGQARMIAVEALTRL